MTRYWLAVLYFVSNTLFAQTVEPFLFFLPQGSNVSILVQTSASKSFPKIKEETLAQYNSHQLTQPASTQKLITALAAELELGDQFRFVTQLRTNGIIENNQLIGDLIIELRGDPTLSRADLSKLIKALSKKGITQINGDIVLNTSIFASHDKASGWSWNNLTACFNAPPSATIIDGNCFTASLKPASTVGDDALISMPLNSYVVMDGYVKTISQNSKSIEDIYCELDVTYHGNNHYFLSGCIPYSKTKKYLKFAIIDSVANFSAILKNEMSKQNILILGKIIESNQLINNNLAVLATHQSEPLPTLLTTMLKDSNNLYADTLFRTIGGHYYNMPGTWRNSSDAVKSILREKAGIDLENTFIADGSGLSRLNLISAEKMMEVLHYIAKHDDKLNMIKKLPIAGIDGTLKYRQSFNRFPFKEHIYAKTGYMTGIYNLAGFIQTKKNNYIAFVQFISGYNPTQNEDTKNSAIMKFESDFYKNFVDN